MCIYKENSNRTHFIEYSVLNIHINILHIYKNYQNLEEIAIQKNSHTILPLIHYKEKPRNSTFVTKHFPF